MRRRGSSSAKVEGLNNGESCGNLSLSLSLHLQFEVKAAGSVVEKARSVKVPSVQGGQPVQILPRQPVLLPRLGVLSGRKERVSLRFQTHSGVVLVLKLQQSEERSENASVSRGERGGGTAKILPGPSCAARRRSCFASSPRRWTASACSTSAS